MLPPQRLWSRGAASVDATIVVRVQAVVWPRDQRLLHRLPRRRTRARCLFPRTASAGIAFGRPPPGVRVSSLAAERGGEGQLRALAAVGWTALRLEGTREAGGWWTGWWGEALQSTCAFVVSPRRGSPAGSVRP